MSSLPRLTAAQFGVAPSYLFYAAWDWRFCLLMSFVTVNAFTAGHLVSSFERSGRLLIMARSIGIDLAVLALRNYSFASFPPVVVQASTYFACAALSMEHFMLRKIGARLSVIPADIDNGSE